MADYTVMLSIHLHVDADDMVDALTQAKEQLPADAHIAGTQIMPGHVE